MKRNIVIAGLGLIGGSLAKAFRKYTDFSVAGIDRDPAVLRAALDCGAIRKAGDERDIAKADILFLCLYPQACLDFVREHLSSIRPGSLVTDTCGIKSYLCPRLRRAAAEHGFRFVGGHPMAGKEKRGFGESDADLFLGASYLVVPCGAAPEDVELLKSVVAPLGIARTVMTTPEEHDRMIAFTSQLPHVLACGYVMSPQCPDHEGFSAGSYRDVSRVANINEAMWSELFLENRAFLVKELDTLLLHIGEIRDAIDAGDRPALQALLQKGRLIKEGLGE